MSKSRRLTSTFFPDKKNCLADMLVNFFLLDKVTLEEHGTTKKLSITFLLRSGQLICFDPSSIRVCSRRVYMHGIDKSLSISRTRTQANCILVSCLATFLTSSFCRPVHHQKKRKKKFKFW